MQPGFVYLASPYSHIDPFVREQRYLAAMRAMAVLLRGGEAVYSPIVHCHELAKTAGLPTDAAFWRNYNFTMLASANALYMLLLPGWELSVGCKEECVEAERLGLPVVQLKSKEYYDA